MKKEARRPITEEICRQLELMMKGGADGVEAARLVGISQGRASKIKKANFDYKQYRENDRKEREEQNRKPEEPEEEQVPGQIAMDITPAEEPTPEMIDRTKFMRFEAGQQDLTRKAMAEAAQAVMHEIEKSAVMLNTKLDRLNDTLSMILRAVRKE